MSDREQMRVKANGAWVEVVLPLTLEQFLVGRGLLPRSVVVEQNGEAVAPSEFAVREVRDGDVLEIVEIVAGG
jgi:thiamine biosynthesis protein ThiS